MGISSSLNVWWNSTGNPSFLGLIGWEIFGYCFNFFATYGSVSGFLLLPVSILIVCIFVGIYQFLLDLICWHIIAHNILF